MGKLRQGFHNIHAIKDTFIYFFTVLNYAKCNNPPCFNNWSYLSHTLVVKLHIFLPLLNSLIYHNYYLLLLFSYELGSKTLIFLISLINFTHVPIK